MKVSVLAIVILSALLAACSRGTNSADRDIVADLTEQLRQENSDHYAFGCVDFDGTVLTRGPSPDAIAHDAEIEQEHPADSWVSETGGVVLGGDGQPQYIVIYDPTGDPTDAQEYERREVATGEGMLTCFVPE